MNVMEMLFVILNSLLSCRLSCRILIGYGRILIPDGTHTTRNQRRNSQSDDDKRGDYQKRLDVIRHIDGSSRENKQMLVIVMIGLIRK